MTLPRPEVFDFQLNSQGLMNHQIYLYGHEKSDEVKSRKINASTYYWVGLGFLLILLGFWYFGIAVLVISLLLNNTDLIKQKEFLY